MYNTRKATATRKAENLSFFFVFLLECSHLYSLRFFGCPSPCVVELVLKKKHCKFFDAKKICDKLKLVNSG